MKTLELEGKHYFFTSLDSCVWYSGRPCEVRRLCINVFAVCFCFFFACCDALLGMGKGSQMQLCKALERRFPSATDDLIINECFFFV